MKSGEMSGSLLAYSVGSSVSVIISCSKITIFIALKENLDYFIREHFLML